MYIRGNLCDYYTLIKSIGKGSYGEVYMVQHNEDSHIYANKRIIIEKDRGLDSVSLNEIVNLSRLDHPNIIKIKDIIIEKHYINIVMKYIPYNLAEYVISHNITIEQSNYIFIQIVDALMYMSMNNIIHGDLSSRNIMIDDDLNVNLIDFGFSKKKRRSTNTIPTIDARPYELFNEKSKIDTSKVDIWALGCIYYFLLVKDVIVDAKDNKSYPNSIEKVLNTESLLDVSKLKYAMIDNDYMNLIMKMLDKNIHTRYNIMQLFNDPLIVQIREQFNIKTIYKNIDQNKEISVMSIDKRIFCIECITKLKKIYNSNDETVFNSLYMLDAIYNKTFTKMPLETMCFCVYIISYKVIHGIDLDLTVISDIFEDMMGYKTEAITLSYMVIYVCEIMNWNVELTNVYDFIDENNIDPDLNFYLINSFIISNIASLNELTKIFAIKLILKCLEDYSIDKTIKSLSYQFNKTNNMTDLAKTIKLILDTYFSQCIIDRRGDIGKQIWHYIDYSHKANNIDISPIIKMNCDSVINNFIYVLS